MPEEEKNELEGEEEIIPPGMHIEEDGERVEDPETESEEEEEETDEDEEE
jgi:hypothetical protein